MTKRRGRSMAVTMENKPRLSKPLNERQKKRMKLLASLTGAIKSPYDLDTTSTINELRGKTSDGNDK